MTTNNTADIADITATTIENLRVISELNKQINEIAMKSALDQAENALDMGKVEAEALSAILDINQLATEENAISDIQMLATRQAMMLASKGFEVAVLIAQFREKILGMFVTLTEQRTNNIWGRTKQLTQGFKF
jgi:hypothetical protein